MLNGAICHKKSITFLFIVMSALCFNASHAALVSSTLYGSFTTWSANPYFAEGSQIQVLARVLTDGRSVVRVHPSTGVTLEATLSTTAACYPGLPAPELTVAHPEYFLFSGQPRARYQLEVVNSSDFPDELFALSPQLPPCGVNPNASRTWVDIFDGNGIRIGGFCGLDTADALNVTWFASDAFAPPSAVYMTLHDRLCDITYTSNVVNVPVDADGDTIPDLDDNCTIVANTDQRDTDGDAIGNICDADFDQNCSVDFGDLAIFKDAFFTSEANTDLNGDGFVNFIDLRIVEDQFFTEPGPSGILGLCIE